jgi:hypothetical protein
MDERSVIAGDLGPGAFRVCPACRAWFALSFVRTDHDRVVGDIRVFHCAKCGREHFYVGQLPKNAI